MVSSAEKRKKATLPSKGPKSTHTTFTSSSVEKKGPNRCSSANPKKAGKRLSIPLTALREVPADLASLSEQ